MASATDPRIDAYIEQAPDFARPILAHLRLLIRRCSPDLEETMKWNVPTFTYRGKILCHFAAFKAHATFGFWHQEMSRVIGAKLGPHADAMGMLDRITRVDGLPKDRFLEGFIREACKLQDTGMPSRRPAKPRAALSPPADLPAGLKRNPAAAKTFEQFSPSQRCEYIEWITSAKRDDTRAKRLATALEWLAEGKARHWKYQNG